MAHQHEAFIAWAAAYDDGSQPGRSRPRHQQWLNTRPIPVICVNGALPLDALVLQVVSSASP